MCYGKDMDEIVAKFPPADDDDDRFEIRFVMDDNDEEVTQTEMMLLPMQRFKNFLDDVIVWLNKLKPSQERLQTSKVMFKLFFDYRVIIDQRQLAPRLKMLYQRALINEKRQQTFIDEHIKEIEVLAVEVTDKIQLAEAAIGNLTLMMAHLNEFHEYANDVVTNKYNALSRTIMKVNRCYCKNQMFLYERFLKYLFGVRNGLF